MIRKTFGFRKSFCCCQRLVVACLFGWPLVADAAPEDRLSADLYDLEQQVQRLDAVVAESPKSFEISAEHRLVDAQVLLGSKDYPRAAILLLDIVEKYPTSRVYGEALVYLGECLYQLRDYQTARMYFLKAAERPSDPMYQKALQRLVELALHTKDYSNVDDWLAKLQAIPPHQLEPSVLYVRGKYLYFRDQVDAAVAAFAGIPKGDSHFVQALYFSGVCQIKKQAPVEAQKFFSQAIEEAGNTDSEKRVSELAQLALGRIHYDRSEFPEAIDRYQAISRDSDLFDSALYEIAWVYIKANDLEKALRALELLVLTEPNSLLAPEVEVLSGNLLIRLSQFGKATEAFSHTRDHYDPLWRDLDNKMRQHNDPVAYVQALAARSLVGTDVVLALPALAVTWAQEDPEIARLVTLGDRVREMEEGLAESAQLLARLDRGVNGSGRSRVFPDLAIGRARAIELENRLVLLRDRIAEAERDIVGAVGAEKQELDRLGRERKALEQEIRQLPQSQASLEDRTNHVRGDFEHLDRQASELGVLIQGLRAQMVAAEKYIVDSGGLKTQEEVEVFGRQAQEVRVMVEGLEKEERAIRESIDETRSAVGIGDEVTQRESEAKRRYSEVLRLEHELLSQLAERLGAEDRARLRALGDLVRRVTVVQGSIDDFDHSLDRKIDERLVRVRNTLDEEKRFHVEHLALYQQYDSESREVGSGVAHAGFQNVLNRLYSVVVQADVGIIDVAWALKQEKTDSLSRLVRDQKGELKGLDQEFTEVLEETQ